MIIIATIFISVVILTSIEFNKINSNYIGSDSFNTAINSYNSNINIISYNEIKNMSNEIITIKKPGRNSVDEIKERINKKLASESDKYSSSSDIKIVGEVFSVKTGENPFIIEITTKISREDSGNPSTISKVKGKYESIEKNYISIEWVK